MSNKKQSIQQGLKDYYADKFLSNTQLDAIQKTLSQKFDTEEKKSSNLNKMRTLKWASSIAASVFVILFAVGFIQTPTVITLAYADIYKDANLNNGMQSSIQQWLNESSIATIPQQYPVEMSKFCRLGNLITTHFRIAGSKQGLVHVFFYHGKRPLGWFNQTGAVEEMNWKLIKARKNLTLIVLYTEDMREESVQNILNGMLPELAV